MTKRSDPHRWRFLGIVLGFVLISVIVLYLFGDTVSQISYSGDGVRLSGASYKAIDIMESQMIKRTCSVIMTEQSIHNKQSLSFWYLTILIACAVPCACPKIYEPVCVNGNLTISNACEAECMGYQVRGPGYKTARGIRWEFLILLRDLRVHGAQAKDGPARGDEC